MTKWLPSLISVASVLLAGFQPSVGAFVAAHSAIFSVVGSVLTLVLHALPSPLGTTK